MKFAKRLFYTLLLVTTMIIHFKLVGISADLLSASSDASVIAGLWLLTLTIVGGGAVFVVIVKRII